MFEKFNEGDIHISQAALSPQKIHYTLPIDVIDKKDERAASSQMALSQNLVRLMRILELSEH